MESESPFSYLKVADHLVTGRIASAKEQYGALWKSSDPLERVLSRFYSRGTYGMIGTLTPKVNAQKGVINDSLITYFGNTKKNPPFIITTMGGSSSYEAL